MRNVFFTSDEHYGHANVIRFCNRPYSDIHEMQEALIAEHNTKVGMDDMTYHLGDMFWRTVDTKLARSILLRLNGKHRIIWGNHDEVAKNIAGQFDACYDVRLVETPIKIWLSHYAHRSWPNSHKGSYHLFGHTHAALSDYQYSHDAGVDANNYAPLAYEEVDALMKSKGVLPLDEVKKSMIDNPWNKEGN